MQPPARLVVGQALLPGDHVGDEQHGQAQQRGRDRADAQLAAEDPQRDRQAERAGRELLVQRQRPQLLQLLPAAAPRGGASA